MSYPNAASNVVSPTAPTMHITGQLYYTAGIGVQTVAADGTFTWSRKTGKKTYVYFRHDAVQSNLVVIAAR